MVERRAAVRLRPVIILSVPGVVCVLHALVLFGLAGFYAVELVRGEGSSPGTVALSAVIIAVFALLLLLLARLWFAGSARAAVPTFVWNGLLVPVLFALYGAGDSLIATGVLVLVVAGVVSAATSLAGLRERS